MADKRKWSTAFFPDELMTANESVVASDGTTDWNAAVKVKVFWRSGEFKNELNPKINTGTLIQPEVIPATITGPEADLVPGKAGSTKTVTVATETIDKYRWTLFIPSAILAKAKSSPALDPIPVTLLLGRSDEEFGYGLRFYFERAGTGALLCVGGREGGDAGGRWNVGITQKTIETIFSGAGLKGKPQVQVLAGYSTGYGMVQTINNDLIPLAPIKRLVFFDCIYRTDKPALPKGESAPALATGDQPEFGGAPKGQVMLDEHKEGFVRQPFNTRRAIKRLLAANSNCVIAAYSCTSGGSPRYALWKDDKSSILMLGTRPIVEIPKLSDLRIEKVFATSSWSPSSAYDALIISRYLELGTKAGLITATDPPKTYQDIIKIGVPARGSVFSSAAVQALITVPTGVTTTDLMTWAKSLPTKPSGSERTTAGKLLLDHNLILPGWEYGVNDLTEYRHAGCLSEFGWELLPP